MPSSKEVRARQNRQKERVAAAIAERRHTQLRRRRLGAGAAAFLIVIAIVIALAVGGNDGGKVTVAPTTVPESTVTSTTVATSTTLAPTSVKGKPCVGLKDALPKGSPPLLLAAGPPPKKLTTQDLQVGTGAVVPPKAKVTVNYVGIACSTGKIFDSSYSRHQTFDANLSGGVIPGWEQGIPGMHIGGIRLLSIPSDLAYASSPPAGSGIAPDEPLFFLVSAVKLG